MERLRHKLLCIYNAIQYNPQNEMLAARKMKRLFLKNET